MFLMYSKTANIKYSIKSFAIYLLNKKCTKLAVHPNKYTPMTSSQYVPDFWKRTTSEFVLKKHEILP